MSGEGRAYDVVVVGGGTAGAVVAARLSEDPRRHVALVEWGPDDRTEPAALQILGWSEMLEGQYDLDYRSVPQERGNSAIRQARARILGWLFGPQHDDCAAAVRRRFRRLGRSRRRGLGRDRDGTLLRPARHPDRTRGLRTSQSVPCRRRHRRGRGPVDPRAPRLEQPSYREGTGFLEVGYTPETGVRSSSSVSYLHPIMDNRPNLEVMTDARAMRVLFDADGMATGVALRRGDGAPQTLSARAEVVLCCGAIDTPRLLLLSGVGPAQQLRELGIEIVADVPGVGENLSDHPEGLLVWQAARPIPPITATQWDVTIMAQVSDQAAGPEVLIHVPLTTYAVHAEARGITLPRHTLTMTPNVTRQRSRGRVWLGSPDPDAPPKIDYRFFTDPEGYDERTLLAGMRMARRVAATDPMARWLGREVFPGSDVTSDEELSQLARETCNSVYHVSCTCRMGSDADPLAVLDPQLRVRGVVRLSVADASAFPRSPPSTP